MRGCRETCTEQAVRTSRSGLRHRSFVNSIVAIRDGGSPPDVRIALAKVTFELTR